LEEVDPLALVRRPSLGAAPLAVVAVVVDLEAVVEVEAVVEAVEGALEAAAVLPAEAEAS